MIVCHCTGVSDSQVARRAAEDGTTAEQAAEALGVGSDCGGCTRRPQSAAPQYLTEIAART